MNTVEQIKIFVRTQTTSSQYELIMDNINIEEDASGRHIIIKGKEFIFNLIQSLYKTIFEDAATLLNRNLHYISI